MKNRIKTISIAAICLSAVLMFAGCSDDLQAGNSSILSTPAATNSPVPPGRIGLVMYGMVTAVNGNSVSFKVGSTFDPRNPPPMPSNLPQNIPRKTHNPNAPKPTPRPACTVPPNAEEKTVTIPETAVITRQLGQNRQEIKASDIQPGEMITIMYKEDGTTINLVDVVADVKESTGR